MKITSAYAEGRLTVYLCGELDHHAAHSAMDEICARIELALPRECVLDMSALTFMDSSGIAVVLKTHRQMCGIGGRARLACIPEQPGRVLAAAGVDRLLAAQISGREAIR